MASVGHGDRTGFTASKMERPVNAHKSGTVTSLPAQPGGALTSGAVICEVTG
jgi:acetyl-CoA/propionyl-CoA carboxylase biotin carboxyl carrier protein